MYLRRYDIKWTAPKAEGSFTDARGDIIISDEAITISSSSITFDLVTKIQISYPNGHYLKKESSDLIVAVAPDILGVDADLRLQGFDILSLTPFSPIGSPKPMHMKLTGRAKFHGSVVESLERSVYQNVAVQDEISSPDDFNRRKASGLVGDVQLSGIKLNQLLVAPNSSGPLAIFPQNFKVCLFAVWLLCRIYVNILYIHAASFEHIVMMSYYNWQTNKFHIFGIFLICIIRVYRVVIFLYIQFQVFSWWYIMNLYCQADKSPKMCAVTCKSQQLVKP
jgi:hypothetical protein